MRKVEQICIMKRFLPLLIFQSTALLVSTLDYRDQAHCCRNAWATLDEHFLIQCENGKVPQLFCREEYAKVTHGFDHLEFHTDDEGKFMIVTKNNQYTFAVRSPYYCVANQTRRGSELHLDILYCTDRTLPKEEDSFDYDYLKYLLILAITLLFLASSLLLAITAVIYFILPQTQNIEEKCTFHLILNQSLICLFAASRGISDITMKTTQLRENCILYWYLIMFIVLSFFTWSALLSYHMWNRFKQNSRANERKVMYRYLLIGYGIPALLVALSNLHVYWSSYSSWSHYFYGSCMVHSFSYYTLIYAILPMIVIQGICVYFFVSLHQKLWSEELTHSPQHLTSNVNKYKFRLVLNAKLLLVTELPFLLITLGFLFIILTEFNLFAYLIVGIVCFISLEGIIVFYMMVIRRKRVLRGLAEKFGLTAVAGWQHCPEEESIEHGNENENEPNREL